MEAHNLTYLLTNFYLIVPEIQREYVWGAKENEEKLVRFIEDVLKSVKEKTKKNVGFLYSYKAHANEHYIIDGQQRFTSLILLLYVLALKESKLENFRKLLNAKEPTLKFSYNVRPLTEQFFKLMINRNQCGQYIKENIWYTQAFDKDMTITSMVNAVEKLHEVIDESQNDIYDSLLEYVEFWYFDVEQTSQGEELYISMNSRGEKLTDSEQIKPLLMKHVKNPAQEKVWDEMEEFFFQKKADNAKLEDVDVSINNFIILVLEIKTGVETLKIQPVLDSQEISLEDVIFEYEQFLSLYEKGHISPKELEELYKDTLSHNVKFILESLLVGRQVFGDNSKELERIKRLVINTLAYKPNTSFKQFNDYFLQPLRTCHNMEVYQHIIAKRDKYMSDKQGEKGFLPIYEYEKVEAIYSGTVPESDIIQAERFAFFDGRIHFLYHDMNGNLDWKSFEKKYALAQNYFDKNGVKLNYQPILLRRLVSLFDDWGMFWGIKYDCTKDAWHEILVKEKWRKPIHILLTSTEDLDLKAFHSALDNITHKHVHEDLINSKLLDYIEKGCYLDYKYNNFTLHPYRAQAESKKYIIANTRNQILSALCNNLKTTSDQKLSVDCDFFWGWDIEFKYCGVKFKWTWNNKLIKIDSIANRILSQEDNYDSVLQKLNEMME